MSSYKLYCTLCHKKHSPTLEVCPAVLGTLRKMENEERRAAKNPVVKEYAMDKLSKQVEQLLEKEERVRQTIEKEFTTTMTDGAGVEWRWERKTCKWQWREYYGNGKSKWQTKFHHFTPPQKAETPSVASTSKATSDAGSDAWRRPKAASDIDVASDSGLSVSTAATLSLSLDEEIAARKMEKQLGEISRLQQRKAQGERLSRDEEQRIRRKPEIDYAAVMVKVRAGAARLSLGEEVDSSPPAQDAVQCEPPTAVAAPSSPTPALVPVPAAAPTPALVPVPASLLAQLG